VVRVSRILVWATSSGRGLSLRHQDFLQEAFLERVTVLRSISPEKASVANPASTPSLSEGGLK